MKIFVTGTAGFGHALATKLLQCSDEVIRIDNINNYYDINLKCARLNELRISKEKIEDGIEKFVEWYRKFYKTILNNKVNN